MKLLVLVALLLVVSSALKRRSPAVQAVVSARQELRTARQEVRSARASGNPAAVRAAVIKVCCFLCSGCVSIPTSACRRSALPPGMRLERQGQQFVLRELLIRDVKLVAC